MPLDVAHPLSAAVDAVPAEIDIVRGWGGQKIVGEAERCADLLSQAGIVLWWDEKKRKTQKRYAGRPLPRVAGVEFDPDDVTAALARGLAILAIRPLGVEFGGLHLCDHPGGFGCDPGSLTIDATPAAAENMAGRGAVWTPRALAEKITDGCLEAVAYDPGPLHTADETEWSPLTPAQILTKAVVDITVGAGAFPVAALRYLTARIMEQAAPGRVADTDLEQAVRVAVIGSCLYGVDIDPSSIELCRIVMALMVPQVDIDAEIARRFRCGDSLLGLENIDQLRYWDYDVARGRAVHGRPLIDVNAVAATGGLGRLLLLADLWSGAMLAAAGQNATVRRHVAAEVEPLAVRVAAGDPAAVEAARARALELLDTDRPLWLPPRNPFHWPLEFPEVFGATRTPANAMPSELNPLLDDIAAACGMEGDS